MNDLASSLVSQADFARMLAEQTGRSAESCQVSISQWVLAGHLTEGEGIRGGFFVPAEAAALLLERLDLGQATGNGAATIRGLYRLAGRGEPRAATAPDGEELTDALDRKLSAQVRKLEADAARAELRLAAEASQLLERTAVEAALARLYEGELTAWRLFLDDAADRLASLHGVDAGEVRQSLRNLFRDHRSARANAADAAAKALAEVTGAALSEDEAGDLPETETVS